MILLHDGCTCSNLSVSPKNWNEPGASLDCQWLISYRFYEPGQKPYQVIIKGTNSLTTLAERRKRIKEILINEMNLLTKNGYNPRTRVLKISPPPPQIDDDDEISEDSLFWEALKFAEQKLEISDKTRESVKSHMNTFEAATTNKRILNLRIGDIRKKDIRGLLDSCKDVRKDKWTANNYNAHRATLSMLFEFLSDMDVCEYNPVTKIKKKKTIQRIRTTLTPAERQKVDSYLAEKYPNFRRFIHIFFHSGSRISELLRLQVKDVDLVNQRFKLIIFKGQQPKEVFKVIKNIALDLWKEQIKDAHPDDYVFSEAMAPGKTSIRPEQVTRRWNRHIKDPEGLNIQADLYSLKHSNSNEVASLLSMEDAAALNSHEGTAMVRTIYATGEAARQAETQTERLKKLGNAF